MQQTKVYVGNLSYTTSQDDLHEIFGAFGEVTEANIIVDRDTGRSKGFAFVTFSDEDSAKSALEFDGKELDGRRLKVNFAKKKQDNRSGGGGHRGGFSRDYNRSYNNR